MLSVTDLAVRYGEALALEGFSLEIQAGEVVAVLGANGAGKSSAGLAIAGLTPSRGSIVLDGVDLTKASSDVRVKKGIVYVPEGRHVFPQLTVAENLRAGGYVNRRRGNLGARLEAIYHVLPRLLERRNVRAILLSGGEQQLLAIGRALMTDPRYMILDEPSLGLSPSAIGTVTDFLRELTEARGTEPPGILVLEQNLAFTRRLAGRGLLLDLGKSAGWLSADDLNDSNKVHAMVGHDNQADPS